MAYQPGFTYVKGPIRGIEESTTSSTATFKARNPLSFGLGATMVEATSTCTQIFGIALNDAATSFAARAGKVSVMVPTGDTVFATLVQTGVATSATSAGEVYGIEKSGNYLRIDSDSRATAFLRIVPREDGSTVDSTDSSVWVSFLPSVLMLDSNTSIAFRA